MNFSKLIVAGLLSGVAYFLLGWLVYGILLNDAMALPEAYQSILYPEEEFKIGFMALSCLIWGFLLSYILINWKEGMNFGKGLLVSAVIGILIALSLGFSLSAMYKFSQIQNVLLDTLGTAVCSGIAGGVAGLVDRKAMMAEDK